MEQIPLWPDGSCPGFDASLGPAPHIETYLLEAGPPRGLVVIFPGGGYAGRAAHESGDIALWLNSAGFHAVVCHYRVAPYRHPCQLHDAKRAVRVARSKAAEWNVSPGCIAAIGFSAGGHLVSMLGTSLEEAEDYAPADGTDSLPSRPDALVLCYPVIALAGAYGHKGSAANLLGENPPYRLLDELSTEKRVTRSTPPSFLWHTADDASVNVNNSLAFAGALRDNGVPFELRVYGSGRHGLGLAKGVAGVESWTADCVSWLKKRCQTPTN